MALVRCTSCGTPQGRKRDYVGKAVQPASHPNPLICGRMSCFHEGLVWLEESEWLDYRHGKRIFSISSAAIKIKVS